MVCHSHRSHHSQGVQGCCNYRAKKLQSVFTARELKPRLETSKPFWFGWVALGEPLFRLEPYRGRQPVRALIDPSASYRS